MARSRPALPDHNTITIRVPIAFRRRGGRKTVTTPDGVVVLSADRSRVDGALVKAIARAFRWRKLIETGVFSTVQEIAGVERVNPSYVGRILRLSLLSPDIVEAILDGRQPAQMTLTSLMRPFPTEWKGISTGTRSGTASAPDFRSADFQMP